ncbi:PorV/PorQ family protein [candidate division KSB1 bacterium]|nr:PorV/PorQ family protein [candidate division KSB1 bacterium]
MQRFILVVLVLCLLVPVTVMGQEDVNKTGSTAANFLKLDVGARAIALGGAFTALATDGTAMLYNPAGIADFTKLTFMYHNIDLYADIRQQVIGLTVPIGAASTFGIYVNYVDLGSIERTNTVSQNGGLNQLIFSSNVSYGITFARRLTDRVLFGVAAKYVKEKLWNESATGISFDFGTIYEPGIGGLRLGLAIRHLGPEMRMDKGPGTTFFKQQESLFPGNRELEARFITQKFAMPISFVSALVFDLVGPTSVLAAHDIHRLSIITEVSDTFDAPIRSIFAFEYEWNSMLALRSGIKQNYDLFEWSFGGGLKIPLRNSDLIFDYAYADYGDLEGVYVTSIELRF